VPIYIIFNKVDLVSGFMAFFDVLKHDALHQVWGLAFPITISNQCEQSIEFFNQHYFDLVNQLAQCVMGKLASGNHLNRLEGIHAFPAQMQLFKKPIESFITELFGSMAERQFIALRGLYFTSCAQGLGVQEDFLKEALSKKFQLVSTCQNLPACIGEPHFLRKLFSDVIFPEARYFSSHPGRERLFNMVYRSTIVAIPLLVGICCFTMYVAVQANIKNIESVNQRIENYKRGMSKLNARDPSILAVLPLLDQLEEARHLYVTPTTLRFPLLFVSYHLKNIFTESEQRAFNLLFWPRIVKNLELSLHQSFQDQNLL
jgi:type VI secretion system protein ImpL